MSSDAKLILKRPARVERWEMQERGDYDLDRFGDEFRNRLYSEHGREVVRSREATTLQHKITQDQ
jgi:hypothetical protein